MSKGSRDRTTNKKKFDENFEKIFGAKPPKLKDEKPKKKRCDIVSTTYMRFNHGCT